ncbi:MAG: LLM class flavin-dependent oxidoreductase [Chloroflexi bacterium]|nr:LLM class flavin-dependent oxidoreductase [Chloroflexota bacterium]MBV9892552.1 LLM class flavin-dependent oxidoreductase [Chloroflexota bacterium]
MARLTFGVALDFGSQLRSLRAQLDRQSALLEAAESAGFEIVAAGESSSGGGFHLPNALLALAAVAQRTSMRLCTGVALLPAWSVWKLAQDAAELDQLSDGRLILGVGLGSAALQARGGWQPDAIAQTADEALKCLRDLWSGAAQFAGDYVNVSGALPILPRNGSIPLWVGGAIRRSASRAGRLGDGWYGGVNYRLLDLPRQAETYRASGGNGAVVVNRVTLLARSATEADSLADSYVNGTVRSYARPGQPMQEVIDDVALVGTPERVAAQLERYAAAGVTHVLARLSLDQMPPEVARTTIELFGREVLPRFQAAR